MIVSIDPGLRTCGVALWSDDNTLINADLVKGSTKDKNAMAWCGIADSVAFFIEQSMDLNIDRLTKVCIELPQIYVRSRSKGDPNDLIQIAAVVGSICSLLCIPPEACQIIKPAEWKGQVPKDVVENRCKNVLTKDELSKVAKVTKSLQHNVWDAVGIGLWFLKRH